MGAKDEEQAGSVSEVQKLQVGCACYDPDWQKESCKRLQEIYLRKYAPIKKAIEEAADGC